MNGPDFDVIILGAGPAGLFCAREAARRGLRVLVADRQASVGRKLSMAGGGMGNITNRTLTPAHYVGENPDFSQNALRAFGCDEALDLLAELNIPWEERDFGQIFCLKPAAFFGEALERQCRAAGVSFRLGENIGKVDAPGRATVSALPLAADAASESDQQRLSACPCPTRGNAHDAPDASGNTPRGRYRVRIGGVTYSATQLTLATGSPAWPQVGSSDFGARLAAAWGHRLVPFRPALTPLVMPTNWPLLGLEGISLNARLTVEATSAALGEPATSQSGPVPGKAPAPEKNARQGKSAASGKKSKPADPCSFRPLLFTHKGLSGPAALVASCFLAPGDALVVDFLPDCSVLELLHQPENGKLMTRNLLARHLPARLAERLVPDDLARRKVAELGKKDRERLAAAVHAHRVVPSGTEGFRKAEAAAGGIAVADVTRRLESRLLPGLFFCGELLDITGLLGGYNIHWALASAFVAGHALQGMSAASA